MSPEREIRAVLWQAEELMHRDSVDSVLPRLLTVLGLKVLADSESWFEHRGYQLPKQAQWMKLKRAPHLSRAIVEALGALAEPNPSLQFLSTVERDWLVREEVLGQLMLLIDTLDLRMEGVKDWMALGRAVDAVFDRKPSRWMEQRQTAPTVNDLIAAVLTKEPLREGTVYDPTCGSGGTLVAIAMAARTDCEALEFFGQDVSSSALYLCTWNMLLHGITRFQLAGGDVLTEPRFLSESGERVQVFDRVVSDPPWGLMREVEWRSDIHQRFRYGVLKGRRADYGFVQHVLASTQAAGIGLLLLPPGALARSGFEQDIRRNLVQADVIEAIVTLPAGSLRHTALPATLMIFRVQKALERRQGIRMVDTSERDGSRRFLDEALVARIVQAVYAAEDDPGFARTVSMEALAAHEFSLVPGVYLTEPLEIVSPAEMAQRVQEAERFYEEAHRVFVGGMDRLAELIGGDER